MAAPSVKIMDPLSEPLSTAPRKSPFVRARESWAALPSQERTRLGRCLVFTGFLVLAFILPLSSLIRYSLGKELHSHIILIPAISAWMLKINWAGLPRDY